MSKNIKSTQLTTKEKKEDIKYLVSGIEQIHCDPYKNVEKKDFEKELSKTLDCTEEEMRYVIQEALVLLRDAHTKVTRIGGSLFPIKYIFIGDILHIVGITENKKAFLGKKLLSINDISIEELTKRIAKLSSQENLEVLFRDVSIYLQSNNILKYIDVSKKDLLNIETSEGSFEINKGTEEEFQNAIVLKPLTWKKSDYIKNPTYTGNNTYRLRMEEETLVFQYNACNNRGHTENELKKFKKVLSLEASKAKSIIVDLRLNGGGDTSVMEDSFENFPDNTPTYVAIGRETFSSAMHHTLFLKQHKNAVLIGENAGQKPNRFGDRKDIVLPNSKIEVQCSYKYFELLPGQDLDVLKPNIPIPITVESYIKQRDPLNLWIKENL